MVQEVLVQTFQRHRKRLHKRGGVLLQLTQNLGQRTLLKHADFANFRQAMGKIGLQGIAGVLQVAVDLARQIAHVRAKHRRLALLPLLDPDRCQTDVIEQLRQSLAGHLLLAGQLDRHRIQPARNHSPQRVGRRR